MVKKVMQAQKVVVPMVYIAILSNLVHGLVGVYLTFFTSWGFRGAAIARVVSALVLPLCLLPYSLHHPPTWWPGWQVHEAKQRVRIFLRFGLPGAAMLLLECDGLSVHSFLVNVSTLAFNCFLGIGVAANVLVGNYLGRHQPQHAKVAAGLGMLLSNVTAILPCFFKAENEEAGEFLGRSCESCCRLSMCC
ncbi:hypothetical protein PsorP6_000074 [Peronosclerospora sorghi]|uniref:Uncharacterized protein n=1 Tax=Peronosclerospora sorghi TaxID=230839 RepID=A0ACC0WUH6_9STRA|nr:hypothetical protein PsorP6_000074 [Peronosclerospora sorghi]